MVNNNSEQSNKKSARILLIIAAVILVIGGAVYTGYNIYSEYAARMEQENLSRIAVTTEAVTEKDSAENPIDFNALKAKNEDIYAWIKVPGTKVDYPVVQSLQSDEFYLKRSATDKSWVSSGAIYTEMVNTRTFEDRVTLIYGHNGYGDTMFTTLHKFEKADFFNEHEFFYIYTPKSKLTYQIISAFKYDNRHIMNSFDFLDNNVFLDFENMLLNPVSSNKNVRENIDKQLTINDNIVVLSTCITNQSSNRYLVCGVLIKDEKTNRPESE